LGNTTPLKESQELFCQYVAFPDENGEPRSKYEAYMLAYENCKNPKIAGNKASLLLADDRVTARISELRQTMAKTMLAEVSGEWLAIRANRVRRLMKRARQIDTLLEARGKEMEGTIGGGETGLLLHDVKSIGTGETAERVDIYRTDTALLKEDRETAKQIAQELGEWAEQVVFNPNTKAYIGFDTDDV
jgi:hypothetical protein